MRVITGTAKGYPLQAPRGDATRPTSDRVKEALFSSLQAMVPGAHVLDLYAGSGALGIEALSRGAASATFVEVGWRAVNAIEANLDTTGLVARAEVLALDVRVALRNLAGAGRRFDLVLVDPPYRLDRAELADVLEEVMAVSGPGALVRLEQADRLADDVAWPEGLTVDHHRTHGDTTVIEATRIEATRT